VVPKYLKPVMWLTDVGFILYWLVSFMNLLPPEYYYQDYNNEMLVAWNLSFIPLDLLISATGLFSLWLLRKNPHSIQALALILLSLGLTFCSGLQAIAFWAFRGELDWFWWTPNLFLMLYPLWFMPFLFQKLKREAIR
jgi:hypothetical protein